MIATYYWRGRPNFGDLLTPLLLKRFTGFESYWTEPKDAELVMVGSLLEHLPPDWSGIIAGSGKLHESTKLSFPNATILSLRGPLTAEGLKGKFVFGDPALLADELIPLYEDKKYHLGLVPHWTDKTLETDKRFRNYDPLIIRVNDDPIKVIRQISQCRKIVSSSLHGIILADAFGIPRRIELAPKMISHPKTEGGDFKWRDYSASLGMELEVGVTQKPDRNEVLEKQYELFEVFKSIKRILKERQA